MAAATMTFVEASVLKQPNEVVEINVAICPAGDYSLPDFLVPRHRSIWLSAANEKTESINFNENPGQAVRSPPQQKQNAISDSPVATGLPAPQVRLVADQMNAAQAQDPRDGAQRRGYSGRRNKDAL
jgi:hypothetical protein